MTEQHRTERLGRVLLVSVVLALTQVPFALRVREYGPGVDQLRGADEARARELVGQWGPAGVDAARMLVVMDVATTVAWGAALFLACTVARAALRRRAPWTGVPLLVLAFAGAGAAACQFVADLLVLDVLREVWSRQEPARALSAVALVAGLAVLAVALAALAVGLAVEPRFRRRTVRTLQGSGRWLRAETDETPPQCGRPATSDVEPQGGDRSVEGIACSGGGIRSAAFSLGGLQALTRRGVYRDASFITAVSGGSYIASAFAVLRGHSRDDEGRTLLTRTLPAYAAGSPEEARLRTHTRYLIPDRGVAAVGVLTILWGLVVNLGTLLLLLFAGARLLGWSLHALGVGLGFTSPDARTRIPGSFVAVVVGLLAAGLLTYVLLDRVRDVYVPPRTWWLSLVRGWSLRLTSMAVVTAVVLIGTPLLLQGLYDAGTRNQPTASVARVVHALGFTTESGCEAANQASWESAKAAALRDRETVANPPPVTAFRYGACGQERTSRTDAARPAVIDGEDSGKAQGGAAVGLLAALVGLVKSMVGRAAPAGAPSTTPGRLRRLADAVRRGLVPWAGTVTAVLLLGVVTLRWVEDAMIGGVTPEGARTMGLALLAVPALKLVTDANRTSVHPFYRERLASAFAVRRRSDGSAQQVDYSTPLHFSTLPEPGPGDEPDSGPELVVCAVANVADRGAVPPGRGGLPFVFSRTVTGIPLPGVAGPSPFRREAVTADYERYAGKRLLTLPAAVAISGAAVSPVMGRMTRRPVRLLLALANVRLGVWLPNPTRVPVAVPDETGGGRLTRALRLVRRQWRQPGLSCLLNEMLGRNGVDAKFLYVTDGGHYDNLGLVEALRRRPTRLYVFDGSGDPPDTWRAFGEAVSLARADLGVEVTVVGSPPVRREDGLLETALLRATATHPDGLVTDVVVGKLGVPAAASWDVRAYAGSDPTFPHRTTADQLYGDMEFEAYRRIGELAGDAMVDLVTAPTPPPSIDLGGAPAQRPASLVTAATPAG